MKEHPIFTNYCITKDGRVWSKNRGRFLKPYHRGGGRHLTVRLYCGGTRYDKYIHSLVLETFVGPRPKGLVGRHFDDIIDNNDLSNLRWDTQAANMQDASRNKKFPPRHGEKSNLAKLNDWKVRVICRMIESGDFTYWEICSLFGLRSRSTLTWIKQGRTWPHITSV